MADIVTNTLQIGGNNLILQDAAVRSSLANAYSASSTYAVGDMVLKDGQLYECNTAITTAEAWTAAHWTAVTVGGELATVKDGLTAVESDVTDLKEDINALQNVPSYTWVAGYVRANGTTTSSSLSQMALLKLKKGQTVTVGTRNTSTGIISATYQNSISVGNTFTPIQATSSTDQFETYSYTLPEDMNIVVCVRTSEYSLDISSKSVNDIEETIEATSKNTLQKYEFKNDVVINHDVTWYVGYMGTNGVTDYHKRGIYTEILTYQQLKDVVIDSTMKVRYALYDSNGTFVEMWYTSPANKTFDKVRAFVVPSRTSGNSEATNAEIATAFATSFVISRDTLQSAFAKTSEINNKVDKSGINQVKPGNIDGSGYIATTITETITENNYWYATNNGTIASGGTKAGMDKAVFDVSEMSGKIAFGYDSTADYGSGSMVVGLSSSSSSPYTRIIYFSTSTIGSYDYFTVDGNVVVMDLDAIKTDYSTTVLVFINIPHSVWLLENRLDVKKTLGWLQVAGYVPSIVVAKDGSGDYTTISDAVAAAKNEDTIYIKDGEYKETVSVNKYVHLVGQSKQGTILYNDIGDYDNAPLLITQGSVCNMTIKSLAPADTSGLSNYAYAVHLDKNFADLAKYQKCEIYNCDIYSDVNDAIGAGTNYASEYDIHDCLLHVAHNPVKTGSCGFKCHNGQNQTTGKVTLRNNVIITEDANGTSCYDILYHNGGISNTQPIEILQVGNVLKYYHNSITNIFVPSGYNYGNSVADMNTMQ